MNLAKISPPASSIVLSRERLLNRLVEWDDRKLVIMHAQAGQGKSTLAADYLRSCRTAALWYTFDAMDDDPAVFFSSFGEALQHRWPDRMPQLPPPAIHRYVPEDIERTAEQWVRRVFGDFAGPALIVFDDYSSTSGSAELRAILKSLFEKTLPRIRFFLLSRSRPEIDVITLRARRSVSELTGRDLRFSAQEAKDLFWMVFGTQVTAAEAEIINRTAEGWPAGLVLLHEYLAASPDGERLARVCRGGGADSRSGIFEYLAREVFALLPDALQVFLLRTSVAESLTATLMAELSELPVDAPTPRPSVSAMVRELRKRNLFISTDEDGTVIRYHTLFRDFLRRRLPASFSTRQVAHLYTSASGHMLRSGDIAGAVDLLLASGQFEKAAQTIERSLQEFLARGQTRTLLRLVEALPDVMQDNPWFLFARAIACRFTDPRSSLALHERALSRFRAERNIAGQMLSLGGVIEACFHSGGDFVRMERAARQARFLLGRSRRQPVELRARLLLALGTAWFFIGRLQRGADALQHALDLFRSRNNHFSQLSCAVYLAPCALYQGDFRLARDAVRRGFEALRAIPDESGGEAALYLVRSMSALFEGLFGDARESLDACRRIAQELRLEAIDLLILEIDGWLKIAQGDYHGAEAVLDECRRKGEEFEKAFFSVSAAHLLSIVYLFQRKLDKAQRMSAYALASRSQSGSRLFHAIYLIVNGAIQMKLGRQDQAEQELLTAVSLLRECAAAQQEANAHLMLALFYGSIKRPDKARRHLRKGFSLGQERGFVYYATFTPKELRELAREAVANNICVEHCTRLLDHPILTAAAPIIIRCLGEFRVTRQGELITDSEWKGKRTKMLVKMLAAHDGQKITRDTVVDILWPDSHLDRHPQLFRTLLHRTRKVLDPVYAPAEDLSFINQEAGSAALNRTLVWTDTGAFLGALKKAESRRSGGDPRETLKAFENAISLYGGDLLPADAHEDWTITLRAQFRRLYARALDEAAEISESLKEHGRSQALYERMFDFDQCNDKACRWLMMRHVSDGRRNEAIRTYERHERALSRELDMVPDEQTRRLYRNIIGG